jgi:PAS domain S-box-containing protein
MSVNRIKQKISFVNSTKNPVDNKKSILQPGIVIVNAYTLIAVLYCGSSAILFYYVVENIFLAIIHLLALLSIVTNYLILIQTKKFNRATNIILTTGTIVVISLFATGGWANTGYLWPFAYLPFAFFLSGRTAIMNWVVALFGGCLIVVLLHFTGAITVPYSPAALVNYFAALLIFIVCIFLFQKATVKREEFLSYTETLLEAAPDAVIVIDNEGRIVKWNPKSENLFGWTADEVLGKPLSETIIPHRYREAHEKGLKHFLETGEGPVLGITIEIQAINKNNVEFDVALSISPTIVQHKHLFIGFVRDTTERKKAEEKIKESEHMFSTLFFKSPVMKAIAEASTGKYIEVNDAFADFLEHTKEEILGKTSNELNILAHPQERGQIIKNIHKDGFARDLETQITSKNGKTRWVSTSIDKMNLNGKDCFLTAAIDITARKEAEEKIRQMNSELETRVEEKTQEVIANEKRFRSMIEKNIDMMTLTTPDGKLLYSSPSLTSVLGYTEEELKTIPAFELTHPDDVPGLIEQMQQIIDTPGKSFYRQQRLLHKDGRWIWCEGTVINLLNDPNISALVSNFRDITERKKFEEAQALFASIVNSSDDAIFSKTLDGIITSWNHGAEKAFGYSSNEIIGKHISILIPPHLQNEENETMEKIRKGEGVNRYETERIKKDGKVIYVSLTISPVKDSLGNIIGASKISRDITERKKAEDLLIKSEKQYRNLFENNPMPMWVIDLTTFKFLDVNEAAISHYGYSREEFLSMTALDIRPEEEKERYKNADHSENIYPANYNRGTWKHLKRDRTIIYVEIIAHKIVFEGKTARLVLSNDVTEKIKAEEEIQKLNEELEQKVIDRTAELQKSNELFSNLFNLNPASIAISSIIDGKLIDVNDAFLQLNGYSSKEEVVGKTTAELNMPVQPEQRAEIVRLLKENKYIKNLEINIYDNQGNKKWIQLSAIMLDIDNVPCLFSFSIDITERKKAEEQLQAVNTELESFSYSVSHDLRSPLRAVNGYAKMLEEDYKKVFDKEGTRLLGVIQENANKMGILIDDLLAFSRLGRKEVNGSFINMTQLAENIFYEVNKTISNKAKVKINSLYPVMADYSLINQVMTNLISNAIKYSSGTEKPSIEIKSEKKDGELIYSVSDNGAGFDMQYAHKLFGVFQRLHSAEEFEGTGVGLAIVKRIISKHNGRVWAEGEPGKGATFYFSLPDYEAIKNN